ncbi:MAG: hypothetical protein GEU74_15590 [Nitriliruptorales bacterium]|nr:hypothetical protein [Nitriliruptorales bacterium]
MRAVDAEFWRQRGIWMPCPAGIALDVADDLGDARHPYALGRAWRGGCRILVEAYWAGRALAIIREKRRLAFERRDFARALCTLVTHELGHVAGLGHFGTGLIARGVIVGDKTAVPVGVPSTRSNWYHGQEIGASGASREISWVSAAPRPSCRRS